MGDTPDSSSKEIKLEAFLKMIEKLDEFNDLDKWLPKTEFIIEYKKQILSKIIDLPVEQQPEPQPANNGL